MWAFVLKRVILSVINLFVIITLTFFIVRSGPDPTAMLLSPQMGAEARQLIIIQFGLDRPVHVQYWSYLTQLFTMNLGESFSYSGRPAMSVIFERIPNTIILLGSGLVFSLLVSLPLSVYISDRKGSPQDRAVQVVSLIGYAFPPFFLGMIFLFIFAFKVPIFPLGGIADPQAVGFDRFVSRLYHLILPIITIIFLTFAMYMLLLRSNMIEILKEDYIMFAVAKGLKRRTVLYRHALRNALIPLVTVVGLQIGMLIGGAILVEIFFRYPGVGLLLFESVLAKDFPVVQGIFLVIAVSTLLFILVTDLLYTVLDPRIRYD